MHRKKHDMVSGTLDASPGSGRNSLMIESVQLLRHPVLFLINYESVALDESNVLSCSRIP